MAEHAPPSLRLLGRDEELAFVVSAIEHGGCVIAGPPGVGKSRLAAEAAARRDARVVRVVGTASAASIPYGAFAHLLAPASASEPGEIPAYIEALRRSSPGGSPTLIVDDVHLIDAASAALMLAVAESRAARIVATLCTPRPVPDAITALWKERRLERLDLDPLPRQDMRVLVESYLGGPAEPEVHTRVCSLTEGAPLYARELLIDARRSGTVAIVGDRWCWTGKPLQMTRLRELVDTRMQDLTAAGRAALELLAVAAPLRLEELAAVGAEDGVAELEEGGLAVVRGTPESAEVDLGHPLFGEVVLAELPAATARRHRRRLTEVLSRQAPADSRDLLRLATLKLESGASDPELFLAAGAQALQAEAGVPGPGWQNAHPTLAMRLADAAGPSLEAALCGARARMALSRFAEVEERLAPLEEEAAQAASEAALEYIRTRVHALHWSGTATDAALGLLERARAWRDTPDWHAAKATLRSWILLDSGRPARAVEAIESIGDRTGLEAHTRLDAALALGVAYSRLALTDRCEALEPEVLELVDEVEQRGRDTGWARYLVDGLARTEAARDLPAVAARLDDGRERAAARGDVPLAAALALVLGRLELIRGHVRDAIPVLEDAVDGLVAGDPRNGRGLALTYLCRAHAIAGDAGAAEDALARARELCGERPNNVRLRLEVARAEAWSEMAHGRVSAARERMLALADDCGEAVACEGEAAYEALRLGASAHACARRLATLASAAESDLLDACAAHAAALAAGDAEAQLRAAESFEGLGVDLLAAEAAAGAAGAFAADARDDRARRARAVSVRHAAQCPGASTPRLSLLPATEQLTLREREIAVLAAGGRSNADIARELVLSVRTVETYVLRACRKLGVASRTALPQVLASSEPGAVSREEVRTPSS